MSVCAAAAGAQTTPSLFWPQPAPVVFPTQLSALQLDATAIAGPPVAVSLPYNIPAIQPMGPAFANTASMDGTGYAFAANLIPASLTWMGLNFPLGSAGQNSAVSNAIIPVPQGNFGTLLMLADMVNHASPLGTFTLNYTDGTSTAVTLHMSDWVITAANSGESRVACWPYRIHDTGAINYESVCMDGYQIAVNPAKTLQSVTPPPSRNYVVLSMVLLPPPVAGTFSYSPAAGTVTAVGTTMLNTVFQPVDHTAFNAATASVALVTLAPVSTLTTTLTWGKPAPITYAAPLTAVQLNAAAVAPLADVSVDLSEQFITDVIFPDGTAYGVGGMDSSGDSYSATALGSSVTYAGGTFDIGAPSVPSAATSETVPLGGGNFARLYLIGAASNAAQTAQTFIVGYTDGTSTTAMISMSSWLAPQNFAGETTVATMAYANTNSGGRLNSKNYLYGYTVALDATKAVSSLTLPPNANVLVLAAALDPGQMTAVPGSFVYTPPAGTVLNVGLNQPLAVTFTPTSPAYFTSANAATAIDVLPASLVVRADSVSRPYCTANPVLTGSVTGQQNGDVFTESFVTSAMLLSDAGAYPITPSVAGAKLADYTQTIVPGTVTVTQVPVAMSLAASAATVQSGANVTLTATVTSTTCGTPGGVVSFASNGLVIGSATLSGGVATLQTSTLAVGTDAISATYGGATDFLTSAVGGVSVLVEQQDFALTTPNGSTLSTLYGGMAQMTLLITPTGGTFAQDVTLTLQGRLPSPSPDTVVGFSPSVVRAGAGAASVVLTIGTHRAAMLEPLPLGGNGGRGIFAAFLLLPLACLRGRARRRALTLVLLLAGISAGVSGCGTGYADRAFPLTVTATSGGQQHTVAVTLHMLQGPE